MGEDRLLQVSPSLAHTTPLISALTIKTNADEKEKALSAAPQYGLRVTVTLYSTPNLMTCSGWLTAQKQAFRFRD